MDYKRIIKSRRTRIRLMHLLSFIPDSIMIRIQYRIKTGRKLNLKNPRRYTEKLQWYKLYYRDPLMAKCADKHEVREYVSKQGYESILNQEIGIYDSPQQIDFDSLPKRFVIKDTLGSGGNTVIICTDKSKLDVEKTKKILFDWVVPKKGKNPGREWVYDQRKNRIIIEKLIESEMNKGGLVDYKFFCFNGEAKFLYVIADRELGDGAGLAIYDADFNRLKYTRLDERELKRNIEKPENYDELKSCAEKLSEKFPAARIDLYDQRGQIIFGEITFFDGSGYMKYNPDDFDIIMGNCFHLPERNN